MSILEEAVYEVENGNPEKGLNLLKNYESKASDDELFSIGQLYYEWGLLDRAIDLYQRLLTLYPDESEIKLVLADAYVDIEKDEHAIELLNSITKEDDFYVQALIQSADLYQSQGLFEVAEQKLLKAKTILPTEPIIDYALGELAFSMGEYRKSINHYENALKHRLPEQELLVKERLAEALAATGKWEEALEYYDSIGAENEDSDFLFNYGLTAFRSDRMDIAIQVWEKLISFDPDYVSAYYFLASAYEKEGMDEKALQWALQGVEIDGLNKELLHFAGRISYNRGETDKAVHFLNEAIQIDPGYKEAVIGLLDIYKKEEMYESIIKLMDTLRLEGEFDPIYQWELARAYYEMEEYQLALNNYDEAYNSFTSDQEFLKEYGYILVEEGRIQDAKRVLNQYLQLDPTDIEVEEYLYRLEL